MNINKINTSLSFKGYENLVSYSIVDENLHLGYMAMKLNNEQGAKDLEKFQEIQKSLFKDSPMTEYLVFTTFNKPGKEDLFFINDKRINLDKPQSKEEEKVIVKLCTLLASLTKRISYVDHHPENREKHKTLEALLFNLYKILKKPDVVHSLEWLGACKAVKHYITAEYINDKIDKKMITYLK